MLSLSAVTQRANSAVTGGLTEMSEMEKYTEPITNLKLIPVIGGRAVARKAYAQSKVN